MSLQQLLELSRKNRTSSIASHLLKSPFIGYFHSDFKAALSFKDALEVARINWAKEMIKNIKPDWETNRLDEPLEHYMPAILIIERIVINNITFWNAAFLSKPGIVAYPPYYVNHYFTTMDADLIFMQSNQFDLAYVENEANKFFNAQTEVPPHLLEKNPFLLKDKCPRGRDPE